MNKYESIIIVNPEVDSEGLKALEEKFTGLINENGKVESVENSIAYEIRIISPILGTISHNRLPILAIFVFAVEKSK